MRKSSLIRSLALVFLPIAPLLAADRVAEATSGRAPDPHDIVLLPLDDVSIPWRENLKVTLVPPKRYAGNPIMKAGPVNGPDGYGAMLYGTVIKEQGKYRMWYLACPRTDERIPGELEAMPFYRPVAYAESVDGIHWTRPNLGLVDFRGSKANNLVLIEPSTEPYARAHDFVAVILDEADPDPARRYKMAYIHDAHPEGPSTATAVSADGIRWKLVNTTSFTKGHFENTSLIRFHGMYYAAGQDHPPYDGSLDDGSSAGRVMKVFFSPDFRHWSSARALAFYRGDYRPAAIHAGQEMHMGAGLWNRGNVIIGLNGRWHGDSMKTPPNPTAKLTVDLLKGLKIDLGLLVSNDGIHYREPVRNFVAVAGGGEGKWDSEGVLQANAFANTATETYIWYSHWNTSNPSRLPSLPDPLPADLALKAPAVGLLTIARDRFSYFSKLRAVSEERRPEYNTELESSCLTRSLTLSVPSRLFLNLDDLKHDVNQKAAKDIAMQVALVDDAEKPLAGYTAEIKETGLKVSIPWEGGSATLPVKTPFRVKITWPIGMNEAKVYAIYVEHD